MDVDPIKLLSNINVLEKVNDKIKDIAIVRMNLIEEQFNSLSKISFVITLLAGFFSFYKDGLTVQFKLNISINFVLFFYVSVIVMLLILLGIQRHASCKAKYMKELIENSKKWHEQSALYFNLKTKSTK